MTPGRPTKLLAAIPLLLLLIPACESDREGEEEGVTPRAETAIEEGLTVLVLTPEKEKSLALRVEEARKETVTAEIELSGWVEARPGAAVAIRAPVPGYLVSTGSWPRPGAGIEWGEKPLSLRPALSPQERLQASALLGELDREASDLTRDLARARAALEAARTQLERARGLLAETAGSRKAVEEATLQEAGAAADLGAAGEKRAALEERRRRIAASFEVVPGASRGDSGSGEAPAPVPLESPLCGKVVAVRAGPGEFVEAGRVVLEVANLESVWVRVPVFEEDLGRIDPAAPLAVTLPPDAGGGQRAFSASPAARRPAVGPLRSVDLFYELPNPGGRLLLDQSLAVRARTRDPREAVTTPGAAVIYDSGGGAWLYVERSRLRYARRRVEPGVRFDGRVEIRRGLREGERVVAAGSSELFGSEFGAGGE